MRIHVAASNHEVRSVCEDACSEIVRKGWTLQLAEGGAQPESGADLYIWDVVQNSRPGLNHEPHERWRNFYLVDRDLVPRFRETMPFPDLNIILKPVARATLSAFVEEASARCVNEQWQKQELSARSLKADRDNLLQCLMQTNLKLQEYDQDRTNFLARAIHDFRAPLTAVTGYCGLLLGEELGSLTEDQREVLERIQRSGRKLSRMANAMLQLSIAPRVQVTVALQKGEIRECIERSLHEIMPATEEKQISVQVDTEACPGSLYFEQIKIEQVLLNLLDNACKFTPRGGSISIQAYPCYWDRSAGVEQSTRVTGDSRGGKTPLLPNYYRFDVRDSGPGIPATHLARVFEEYTSYGGGVDRSGGGLGLAICRMILKQHQGRIWAESTSHGAVFSFVLPLELSEAESGVKPQSRLYRAGSS